MPPASKTNVDKRNKKGETQLHIACRLQKLDKAKSLLVEGADPNTQDYAGWTPLHEVAQEPNVALVDGSKSTVVVRLRRAVLNFALFETSVTFIQRKYNTSQ